MSAALYLAELYKKTSSIKTNNSIGFICSPYDYHILMISFVILLNIEKNNRVGPTYLGGD